MKKRFLIITALLSLCFALAAPVSAGVEPVDPDSIPTDPGFEAISADIDIEPINADITDNMFLAEFMIWDDAEMLTVGQWDELNALALEATNKYQCDVRIVTVLDMGVGDPYEFAKSLYLTYNFGWGEEQSGVLLMLSDADRDYALIAHGFGNVAFTDHGKNVMLDDYILPLLAKNMYYDAFAAYLDKAAEFLGMARAGRPFDYDTDEALIASRAASANTTKVVLNIVIPIIVALIVCLIFRSRMKTARKQRAAGNYIPEGGFVITGSSDTYLYSTETRTEIQEKSGGTSVDSGGFSGSSGKY